MQQELRLYSFVNYYLSPIQQGVQTGHAAVDLVRKYNAPRGTPSAIGKQIDMVADWADNFKTFIILNGGNNASLLEALSIVELNSFPNIHFHEDAASLNGLLTCVAVVVPEDIFNCKPIREFGEITAFTNYKTGYHIEGEKDINLFNFTKLITTSGLAR